MEMKFYRCKICGKIIAMVEETLALVKPLYIIHATNGPTIPIEKMFAPKVVNPP